MNEGSALDGAAVDVAINGSMFPDAEETAAAAPEPRSRSPEPPETPAPPTRSMKSTSVLLRRLLDPGYRSPARGIGREAVLRDFPIAPVTWRLLAVAVERQRDFRRGRDAAESIIGPR